VLFYLNFTYFNVLLLLLLWILSFFGVCFLYETLKFSSQQIQNLSHVSPSFPSAQAKHFDWSLCILCQETSDGKLIIGITDQENKFEGYKAIESFLNCWVKRPISFVIQSKYAWIGWQGIANTLMKNKAKYHKRCKNECSERNICFSYFSVLAH